MDIMLASSSLHIYLKNWVLIKFITHSETLKKDNM
jgi:hypothetical protein